VLTTTFKPVTKAFVSATGDTQIEMINAKLHNEYAALCAARNTEFEWRS